MSPFHCSGKFGDAPRNPCALLVVRQLPICPYRIEGRSTPEPWPRRPFVGFSEVDGVCELKSVTRAGECCLNCAVLARARLFQRNWSPSGAISAVGWSHRLTTRSARVCCSCRRGVGSESKTPRVKAWPEWRDARSAPAAPRRSARRRRDASWPAPEIGDLRRQSSNCPTALRLGIF